MNEAGIDLFEAPGKNPGDQPSTDLVARGHAVVRERLEAARAALEQRTGKPHRVVQGEPVQGRLIERVSVEWSPVARLEQPEGYALAPWHPEMMERHLGQEVRLQLNLQGTYVRAIEVMPSVDQPSVPREAASGSGRQRGPSPSSIEASPVAPAPPRSQELPREVYCRMICGL